MTVSIKDQNGKYYTEWQTIRGMSTLRSAGLFCKDLTTIKPGLILHVLRGGKVVRVYSVYSNSGKQNGR